MIIWVSVLSLGIAPEVDNTTQTPLEGFAHVSRSPQLLSGASPRQKPSLYSAALRAPKTHLWEIIIPLLGYFQHGKHGNFGITIRHILIVRIIALRWADGTEPACVYSHSPFLLRASALSVLLFIEAAKLYTLCVSACPQKQSVLAHDMFRTHGFVEQRMTRIFRNYHPVHFDSTDHRFAMGG